MAILSMVEYNACIMLFGAEGGPKPLSDTDEDAFPSTLEEEQLEGVVPLGEGPIDIENPHLDPEVKKQVTEAALTLMEEDVLPGLSDYAIFSSTGMYLQGLKHGRKDLTRPPGDLDIVVGSERTLGEIKKRLANISGLTFDRGGEYGGFTGQPTKILSGQILMELDTGKFGRQKFIYKFEVFFDTKIAPKKLFKNPDKFGNLNVLNWQGLEDQYLNNLAHEYRVDREVNSVFTFLTRPRIELRMRAALTGTDTEKFHEWVGRVLKRLQLTENDLRKVYVAADQLRSGTETGIEAEQIVSGLAKVLSGEFKTKILQRKRDLGKLMLTHDDSD